MPVGARQLTEISDAARYEAIKSGECGAAELFNVF